MAWPKGVPRGPRKATAAPMAGTDIEPKKTPRKWNLKAQANWEDMDTRPENADRFHIPNDMIPEGLSLLWVTDTVFGQPQPQSRAEFERKGWTPICQSDLDGRFDGMFMPKGAEGEINNGGQVLMCRPKEITDVAERREFQKAREQLAIKEAALRGGDIPNVGFDTTHNSALASNKIGHSWERIAVPTDE
jgi:hypothetical protein